MSAAATTPTVLPENLLPFVDSEGYINLVSVNKVPERAKRLIGILIESVNDRWKIRHAGNAESELRSSFLPVFRFYFCFVFVWIFCCHFVSLPVRSSFLSPYFSSLSSVYTDMLLLFLQILQPSKSSCHY